MTEAKRAVPRVVRRSLRVARPSVAGAARPIAAARSTIHDVAARAGVSIATVSRVLSGNPTVRLDYQERVFAAAAAVGYRPSRVARSLRLRSTHSLGLIVTDILNPFFPELVRSIEDRARELGYALVLCNGAEDPEREAAYLEVLLERQVDGIIIASSSITNRQRVWLATSPVAVTLVNCDAPGSGLSTVISDNRAGGRLAIEHLLALGHRRLGYLAGRVREGHREGRDTVSAERLAGVREAVAAAGSGKASVTVVAGDPHGPGGEAAMAALMERAPATTGVLAFNDLMALGALRVARRRGRRVPDDLSIVGFDGLELGVYADPPLTTVAQNVRRMGHAAVESLVTNDPAIEPGTTLLPVRLIQRASTAEAPVEHRGRPEPGTRRRHPPA
jgi:LacI family transcriptional regulator